MTDNFDFLDDFRRDEIQLLEDIVKDTPDEVLEKYRKYVRPL